MQLFSRMVIGLSTRPIFRKAVQRAYDRIHAVMATPKFQPVFSPIYRLVSDKTPPSSEPMTIARQVSCAIESPRPL
jgi:hypothetical protein